MAYSQILPDHEICADCQLDCRKQTDLFGFERTRDLYQIVEGDRPTNKFCCSIICVENYLLYRQQGWKMIGAFGSTSHESRAVYYVGVQLETRFKPYNDQV